MDRTQGPTTGQPPLRLVRLLGSEPRRQRRRRHVFTRTQETWIKTALHNARRAFGTWACLADAMGVGRCAVVEAASHRTRSRVSAEMAIRLAFAAGISLDGLLRPALASADVCPTCGAVRGAL